MASKKKKDENPNDNNRVRFLRPTAAVLNEKLHDAMSTPVRVTHTIVDRRAGSTVIEEICGRDVNLEVVAEHMKKPGVRSAAARWFLENRAVKIVEENISSPTWAVGETLATRDGILKSLNADIDDESVYSVVAEFVVSLAYDIGLINDSTKMTTPIVYEAKAVRLSDLALDLVAQSAIRVAESVKVKLDVDQKRKMSKASFARAFAEALQQIGYELHRAMNVQQIFDDAAKAIAVKVMVDANPDRLGEVHERWVSHPLVEEFSHNYVFLSAALSIPVGAPVSTVNSLSDLEKEAPIAFASLKGSKRYQVVTAAEYLRTYGKKTIVNLEGEPVYFVGYREASIARVAQCVSIFPDAVMPTVAKNVIPGPEGVSKYIAGVQPSGEYAKTSAHINELVRAITLLAETGDPRPFYDGEGGSELGRHIGEAFFLGDDGEKFSEELAALISDACYLHYDPDTGEGAPVSWVYSVRTKYNRFIDANWSMCYLPGGEFVTDDIGLLLLVCDDFAAQAEVEPRAQLMSEKALFTRIIGLDATERVVNKDRVSFDIEVANQRITGRISTHEIGMHDMADETKFVVPVHNKLVVQMISSVYDSIDKVIESADVMAKQVQLEGNEDVDMSSVAITHNQVDFLKMAKARALLLTSQSIPAQYRQIVSTVMRMRAVAGKTSREVLQMRGTMQQQSFNAYADVFALVLLLKTNGLPADFVVTAISKPEMARIFMMQGSDRNLR